MERSSIKRLPDPKKLSEAIISFLALVNSEETKEHGQTLLQTVLLDKPATSTRSDNDQENDIVDLKAWKAEVLKDCSSASFEKMIRDEPDLMPRSVAEIKIPLYLQMIRDYVFNH
jgi:hypothetical protein